MVNLRRVVRPPNPLCAPPYWPPVAGVQFVWGAGSSPRPVIPSSQGLALEEGGLSNFFQSSFWMPYSSAI